MKYTKSTVERALKKLSKGETFKDVAESSGININTLKYYAQKATKHGAPITPRTIKKETVTIRRARNPENALAQAISTQLISDLRQIFRS